MAVGPVLGPVFSETSQIWKIAGGGELLGNNGVGEFFFFLPILLVSFHRLDPVWFPGLDLSRSGGCRCGLIM